MQNKDLKKLLDFIAKISRGIFQSDDQLAIFLKLVALKHAIDIGLIDNLVFNITSQQLQEEAWHKLIELAKENKNQDLSELMKTGFQLEQVPIELADKFLEKTMHIQTISERDVAEIVTFMMNSNPSQLGTLTPPFMILLAKLISPKKGESIYCASPSTLPLLGILAEHTDQVAFESINRDVIVKFVGFMLQDKVNIHSVEPLSEPSFTAEDYTVLQKFGKSVSLSPMGYRLNESGIDFNSDKFNRFKVNARTYEVAMLEHLIAQTNGKSYVTVVSSVLSTNLDRGVRQLLIDKGLLEMIIYLPQGAWSNTLVTSALLVLDTNGGHESVRMVDLEKTAYLEKHGRSYKITDVEQLVEAMEDNADHPGMLSIDKQRIIAEDYVLTSQKFLISETGQQIDELIANQLTKPLKALVEFERSLPIRSRDEEGDIQVFEVGVSDLNSDYIYQVDKQISIPSDMLFDGRKNFLRPNDIVLSIKGVTGKVALIPETVPAVGEGGWVVSGMCSILRVQEDSGISPEVLFAYLRSQIGQELLNRLAAGNTALRNIPIQELKQIPVIIPDAGEQSEIKTKVALDKQMQETVAKLAEEREQRLQSFWYFK